MTGYTHELVDKDLSLKEFALSCARSFGACITLRDEDPGVPIPEEFPLSDYHPIREAEARAKASELSGMTLEQRIAYGQAKIAEARRDAEEGIARREANLQKMRTMLEEILAWKVPTHDHLNLKNFMLQQIRDSITFETSDYYDKRLEQCELTPPEQWHSDDLHAAHKVINRFEEIKALLGHMKIRENIVIFIANVQDNPGPILGKVTGVQAITKNRLNPSCALFLEGDA